MPIVETPSSIRSMLNVVVMLIVVGVGLWLINTYVPMAGSIKTILNIVVVLATIVGVLQAFGLWNGVKKVGSDLRNHQFTKPDEHTKL